MRSKLPKPFTLKSLELASQPPPASTPTHIVPVTQDQFAAFLNIQATKFDIMTEMFRDMIVQNMNNQIRSPVPEDNPFQSTTPPPSGEKGSNATNWNATIDLERVLDSDNSMEVDSDLSSSSRKRNDVRPSPVKPPVQLSPLSRMIAQATKILVEIYSEGRHRRRFQQTCLSH
jgi:hypothetical protein